MATTGRLTLPIQQGMDSHVHELITRLGADAVRDSDGTELPGIVHELATKVYAKYFVGRGDNAWADAHPDELTRIYLMSDRTPALSSGELRIELMTSWFADQVRPDTDCDLAARWQVINRTTGEVLAPSRWRLADENGTAVLVDDAQRGHVYTVGFLAVQTWDPTQMYNYITNDWASDPSREKEKPFDVRHEATWNHVREGLASWLESHPEVDVVRFTTFFYHFTLVYGADGAERFVDWFGYSASVSLPALEAFEQEMGYALTAEDFIDEGYYNSPFRVPRPAFRDWIAFQHRFVTEKAAQLVEQVHEAGKEAIMFLGDNWIGVEPYGPHFADTGLDAVVGSVGSGATCRMISDIPHVSYTEGRFLPYFFPDVFTDGGDPVGEANESWLPARRAIVRSPLDRMGYGGYLSLALEFPEFVDRVEEIVDEFRSIRAAADDESPSTAPFAIGVLNAWGALRSWQTHMVAHAIPHRQTYSYIGALESLAGLPVKVEFLSFEEVLDGVPERIGVLVVAGGAATAFGGGGAWGEPRLVAAVNEFIAGGGGFIGIGEPSFHPAGGTAFQLSDALGVDRELGWGLSTSRAPIQPAPHFITADLQGTVDVGEGTADVILTSPDTHVLDGDLGGVRAAAHRFGDGRAVYFAGLPYSSDNSRLLHRALYWAAGQEEEYGPWTADDPRVEAAHYPVSRRAFVYNNSTQPVRTVLHGEGGRTWTIDLGPADSQWLDLSTP